MSSASPESPGSDSPTLEFEIFQPRRLAHELFTEDEFIRLAFHLKSGDDPFDYVVGLGSEDGREPYVKARTVPYPEAVLSTWKSCLKSEGKPFAAVVYAGGDEGTSTYGCVDLDAHGNHPGQAAHVDYLARKLLSGIRKILHRLGARGIAVIVEHSGRGWHFFFISLTPKSTAEWRRFMGKLIHLSGLDAADTRNLELLPIASGKRKGVRLPGSANVKTWNPAEGSYRRSEIVATAGLQTLLSQLPPVDAMHERFTQRGSPLWVKPQKEKGGRRCCEDAPEPWQSHKETRRLLRNCAICAPATRHNRLASLVGQGAYHFSKEILWEIAHELYRQAAPECGSDHDTHRLEFEDLYRRIIADIEGGYGRKEWEFYERLDSPTQKDIFRIARNFAQHGQRTKKYGATGQFPLSGRDLAQRLQIGIRTAYNHRKALIAGGCIRKVAECVKAKKAEEFVWLLSPIQEAADPPIPSRSGAVTAGDSPAATASVPTVPGAGGRATKEG